MAAGIETSLNDRNLGMTSKNTKEACEAIKVMQGEIPFTPRPEQVYEFFERWRPELRVGEKRSLGSSSAIQIFKTTIPRGKNPFSPLLTELQGRARCCNLFVRYRQGSLQKTSFWRVSKTSALSRIAAGVVIHSGCYGELRPSRWEDAALEAPAFHLVDRVLSQRN